MHGLPDMNQNLNDGYNRINYVMSDTFAQYSLEYMFNSTVYINAV